VWRVNTDGSVPVKLTAPRQSATAPRWSSDGAIIAFVANGAGSNVAQIWLLPSDGGEASQLTTHATSVSAVSWSPDRTFLYFLAADPPSEQETRTQKEGDDVFAFEEDFKQVHLWRIAVADKAEQPLTRGDSSIQSYELSRDGRKIVVHRAPGPFQEHSANGDIGLVDAGGGDIVPLAASQFRQSGARLSPDNSKVLFVAMPGYYTDRLFVVNADGGTPERLIPEFPHQVVDADWSKTGDAIFVLANLGLHTELFCLDLATGRTTQLTEGQHDLALWTYHPATDQHLVAIDSASGPGDLWVLPAGGTVSSGRQVTRVFDYLAREFSLPRQERVEWKGADGVRVEGILNYPLDYKPGARYPLVVRDGGVIFSSMKFGFGSWGGYTQVLAAKGYAVLETNPRGVGGYGDEFLRDMVGHYFQNAHLDVLAGVDRVIEMGVADPGRLARMGWSAGGTMTNKLLTVTDRFKAASSGAGVVNWISMYAQSDVRYYRTPWFGGTPWQANAPFSSYWDHSPLKDLSKVKTPTLILVGESDVRVPPAQSVELYRALKSNGVPTRLYIAPREPHGWRELRHQLFKMNAELEWFEKYVTGRPYIREVPPPPDASRPTS